MGGPGNLLDRLPPRPLVASCGLAMAATWAVQKLLMVSSPAFMQTAVATAVATDAQRADRLLAASSLQVSLGTSRLLLGLVALPGLLVLWRTVMRGGTKGPVLLLLAAIAWPALAAIELAFLLFSGGAFPGHDLVVGAPFVASAVAALFLARMRAQPDSVSPWSIAVYALAFAYFAIPRFLMAIPGTGSDRLRMFSVGGLVLLAVVIGTGLLVAFLGWTMKTSTSGAEASSA